MIQNGTPGIQSALSKLAAEGADAPRIAEAAVSILHAINAALSPIVSQRGVAALYRRSLYLTRSDFPWLTSVYDGALAPGEFEPLHAVLAQQTRLEAMVATDALLRTFHELLTSLIGGSLTERLLKTALDTSPANDSVQDASP